MTTRSLSRRWLAPAALTAVALLFACLKGRAPTDASASDVRFDLHAAVSGGSTLHITVVYLDQGTTSDVLVPVTLLDQRITVATGTQSLPLTIDLTRCLADPQHVPQGPTCELFAAVTLLQGGAVIDSVSVGPVTVTPGQTVHASTSLTPIGHVDVYPPSATIKVEATTKLYDTVFSPTDSILPGTSVTWTSRNTAIATVDTGGTVTGVSAGTTTVLASVGGQQDSATITVLPLSTGGTGTIVVNAPIGVTFQTTHGSTCCPANAPIEVTSLDTLVVISGLTDTVAYTAGQPTGWLTANLSDSLSLLGSRVVPRLLRKQTSSGIVTPGVLDLVPNTTALAAGTYTATVTVYGTNATAGSVKVTYTVGTPAVVLTLSPNPVVFNQYAYGSTVAPLQTVTASGIPLSSIGTVSYTGADANWLTVTAASATTATGQPTTTALHLGTDTATVPISATGASNSPVTLTVLVNSWVTYTKVVLGASFGCGLTSASTVYCWGGSGQGELGDGGPDLSVTTPVRANIPYSPSNPVIDVEAGGYHACALQQSGAVYCWGRNTEGELGIGTTAQSPPTLIASHTYQTISLGEYFSCGIEGTPSTRTANYVDCWGNNAEGQFGDGNTSTTAQTTPILTQYNSYYSISAGALHMCGVTGTTGSLYCWGNNSSGQLGNTYAGTNYPSPQFVNVLLPAGGPAPVASVSAGSSTTCAVDGLGNGYCWGDDSDGQIGNGTTTGTPVTSPTVIPGGYHWTSISVGIGSVCGIALSGGFCWGYNNYGQLGNGSSANSGTPTPTAVSGSAAGIFLQMVVGEASNTGCFIITASGVSCFGLDGNGQFGDGAQANSGTPIPMIAQPAPAGVSPSRVVPRRPISTARRQGRT